MDSKRHDEDKPRRRRSRSSPSSSDEERRRQRRRRDREAPARETKPGSSRDERRRDRDYSRERGDGRDRKRRRSHSPAQESSRGRVDRTRKHRGTQDRSPSHRQERRDDHRNRGKMESKTSREGSAAQVSRKSNGPLPSQASSFQQNVDPSTALVPAGDVPEKQKPNFAPTGLLAAASNSVTQVDGSSIVLKYHEPAEARKPPTKDEWKLFVFKGADILETIELSTRSCWLVGREITVVDLPAEHPSISKQHAVIQFRYIEKTNEFGDRTGRVRPYLIDLESANGTLLNKDEVPPSRYLELRDKDMIQFGHSTREQVPFAEPQ
ncbi:SMAD/FHA [Glarea lozoyensis ATCC 20868]|uniref:SMAD/FHA n=1 Tax=Glarea lozoyensis (strain ATCC 20868 / MF5171) TaxID=1116229 RepID=S3D3U4_GLAL2|nr:SMAD/FHA [Glarea lozoyensis ATCC 20868]EPE26726.1 SMAD/FHA [Glarea lozoyensis ATCC 20868]